MLARIRDVDLFAAETHYHHSCRKAYTRSAGLGRSMNIDVRNNQLDLEKTHQKAFESICNTVSSQVIGKKQIIRLDDLREQYIRELNQTSYPNPNYRAEKLKAKLEKHDCIGERLGLHLLWIIHYQRVKVNIHLKLYFVSQWISRVQ